MGTFAFLQSLVFLAHHSSFPEVQVLVIHWEFHVVL
jgi:hypothetical protein